MAIYVVRHKWVDNEYAQWEHHPQVEDKVVAYLKKSYTHFATERPIEIKHEDVYIYLCYQDSEDIHSREITNITFFISRKPLKENLCEMVIENLMVKSSVDKRRVVLVSCAITIAIGAWWFQSFQQESTEITKGPKVHNYEGFVDNWNHWASDTGFQLERNPIQMMQQLNQFVTPFDDCNQTIHEYRSVAKRENSQELNASLAFLEKHTGQEKVTFDLNMSQSTIEITLTKLTKEPYFNSKVVDTIEELGRKCNEI